MMEVALFLADQYGARRDLLIAGALLHDIGKLGSSSYDFTTDYSLEGNLVGHIVIGVGMLRERRAEFPGSVTRTRCSRFEHLILSHHGDLELGSPVRPMTVEALILATVDDLDATLHQFRAASRRRRHGRPIHGVQQASGAACSSSHGRRDGHDLRPHRRR